MSSSLSVSIVTSTSSASISDLRYQLRVIGAELDEVAFSQPPSTSLKVVLPQTSYYTSEIPHSFKPSWNRDFQLESYEPSTPILLKIEQFINTKNPFKAVGEKHISIAELLEICHKHHENIATLAIYDTENGTKRVGTIMVRLNEIQTEGSTIQRFRDAFDGLKLKILDSNPSNPSEMTGRILLRIKTLRKVIDHASKVHPLIDVAWSTVASLDKLLQGHDTIKRSVIDLVVEIDGLLSFVDEVHVVLHKSAQFEEVIVGILTVIGQCCQFLQEYNPRDSPVKRAANSLLRSNSTFPRESEHEKIENFRRDLSHLQKRLYGIVSSQTLITCSENLPGRANSYITSTERSVNPPGPTSAFTGREDILKKISNCLIPDAASGNHRVQRFFVLWGLGGSGKTQIALKFASAYYERFLNVYMIDASSESSIRSSLTNIGHTVGLDKSDPIKTLRWLAAQENKWLLIYDNADNPEINLRDFFPKCGYGSILITTRNRQCRSHAMESNIDVSAMDHEEAVALLLKMAGSPHTDPHISIASALVIELGYLPLAIVQAGSYIATGKCTLSQYPDLYRTSRAKLLRELPTQSLDDYRKTVSTTWEISYAQLKPFTQTVFTIFAFLHRDGISEEIFRRATLDSLRNTDIESHHSFSRNIPPVDPSTTVSSAFRTETGEWGGEHFGDVISELYSFSFILENGDGIYSIHPLVQSWSRDRLPEAKREATLRVAVCILYHSMCFDDTLGPVWLRLLHEKHIRELATSAYTDGIKAQFARGFNTLGFYHEAASLMTDVLNFQRELLGDEHPYTLSTMAELSRIYEDLGRWNDAKDLGTTVLKSRRKLSGSEHPDTLNAMTNLASTCRCLGEWKLAEKLDNKVLIHRRRSLGDSHPNTLKVMTNLSYTNRRLGLYRFAELLDLHVYEVRYRIHHEERLGILGSMISLALTYRELGKYRQARELEMQVFDGNKQTLGDDHPDTLSSMARIACVDCFLGEVREAETLEVQVLKVRRRKLGEEHCDTLEAMISLSWTYRSLGKYREAITLDTSVLDVRKRTLGEEHHDTLWAMANLAWSQRSAGDYATSEILATRVFEARKQSHGMEHPDTLRAMGSLACTYKNLGKYEQAKILEVQVLEKRKKLFGDDHSETLRAMSHLACTYNHLGHYGKAEIIELDVIESRKRLLGQKHPDTLSSMDNLAEAFGGLGRYQDAENLETQVIKFRRQSLGENHPDTLCAMVNLANIHKGQGNDTAAEALELRVLEARKRVLGDEHPDTIALISSRAHK